MSEVSIKKKIDAVRLAYERELFEKRSKIKKETLEAEAALNAALSADYTEPYKRKYAASLSSLERIYESIAEVHKGTRGISFRIHEHLPTVTPRPVARGGVEDYFRRLVSEGKRAISALNAGGSIEEDVPYAKAFCQCLADLRYIVRNADSLLNESDAPKGEREEAAKEPRQRLAALRERERTELSPESLHCYGDCMRLREEMLLLAEKSNEGLLGRKQGFDESYSFFMGYTAATISEENRAFVKEVLGVKDVSFAENTPIFFDLTPDHSAIIIRAKHRFFSTAEFKNLIRNLYFTFASNLPKRGLTFTGVECGVREAVAQGLENQIKMSLGDSYVFAPVTHNERDLTGSGGVLNAVLDESLNRSSQYNFVDDIFEYNRQNPETAQRFIMFCANNYPAGYNGNDPRLAESIYDIALSGAKGIITVICDSTDMPHTGAAKELDPCEIGASVIEIGENGYLYDGRPATVFPTVKDFDPRAYWQTLNKYCTSAESLMLDKVLASADRDIESGKLLLPPLGKKLAVPLGMGDGTRYDLELNFKDSTPFGLIVGSTGSGKSALLHSIILSMCSYYSPEDLELYLVDFKSNSQTAPEFSHYKREEGVDNLYMPQIKYLLLKSRSENALDLLSKIKALFDEKNAILGNLSIQEYNRREEEKKRCGEPYKKLPYSIFIIDEVNRMLGGDFEIAGSAKNGMVMSELSSKLDTILRQVRSAGIGIFFAGQTPDGFETKHLGQIGTRIVLKGENDSNLRALFKFDTLGESSEIFKKTVKGTGLVSVEMAEGKGKRFVSLAFAGDPWSNSAKAIARSVRSKYPAMPQIEAGSEAAFPASEADDFITAPKDPRVAAAQKDRLLLGMSSATSSPVYLEYSRRESSTNYYAFSDADKLLSIERTAILSFLREMAKEGRGANEPRINYCALEGEINRSIGEALSTAPTLAAHVKRISDRRAIAEHILDLAALLRKRERASTGEISHHTSTFTVIHGIEWLTRGADTYWLPDFKSPAASPRSAEAAVSSAALDQNKNDAKLAFAQATGGAQLSDKMASLLASKRAMASAAATSAPEVTAKVEREPYTDEDVRRALKALYLKGNRYGIFLLVSSSLLPPVKSLLFDVGAFSEKQAIYGSFLELQNGECDETASETCVFVNSSFAKTRLLDFDDKDLRRLAQRLN